MPQPNDRQGAREVGTAAAAETGSGPTPQERPSGSPEPSLPSVEYGAAGATVDATDPYRPSRAQVLSITTLQPEDLLCDRFRIVRFIARGAMGEVYEAADLELNEHVAIKVIRADISSNERAMDRFRREIHLARKVTHPNVCRVFDLSRHRVSAAGRAPADVTFLSMELLHGETLAQRLRREGRMSMQEALPIIGQMAAGLSAAHRAGVVHRDFKTGNVVLLGEDRQRCRAVITDFGLARSAVDEAHTLSLTNSDDMLGTPAYMAPEQVEGGEITAACDIYALGVVMFEMVTGRWPFEGETRVAIAAKRLTTAPPSPCVFAPELDPRWESAILRCLELHPRDRFSSAEEVARALEERSAPLRFGPYEVLSAEGSRGKSRLYRAWDAKHERMVAVQNLSSGIKLTAEARQEIKRELRIASRLSHPNICPVYEIGQQDDRLFLVMEHLDGERLSDRLHEGPLAIPTTLRIGSQLASALGEAHRLGIVHGHLAPRTVVLDGDDCKLMELGLNSASVDGMLREANVSAADESLNFADSMFYLAPERLGTGAADHRADIFAMGALLYEMSTGRKPFSGKTYAAVAAQIISSDPPLLNSEQSVIPKPLQDVIRKCLAKDPKDRFQTAQQLQVAIERVQRTLEARGLRKFAWWEKLSKPLVAALAGAVCVLGVLLALSYAKRVLPERTVVRAYLLPPEEGSFNTAGTDGGMMVSPDGRRVLFVATTQRTTMLWVRPLNSVAARPLNGTEGATNPFWSADGKTIGFIADNTVKLVGVDGGPVLPVGVVERTPGVLGASMNEDGVVLLGNMAGPITRIDKNSGTSQAATKLGGPTEGNHLWPYFLPDGKHFLYISTAPGTGPATQTGTVYLGRLDSDVRKPLGIQTNSNVIYASGYLLYLRNAILMAQPFDTLRMAVSGPATAIAEGVVYNTKIWRGIFSASSNGVLAYQTGKGDNVSRIAWFDRSGKRLGNVADEQLDFGTARLSSRANKIAVDIFDPEFRSRDLWVYDVASGVRSRLTNDPMRHEYPVWSRDGTQVVFSAIGQDGKRNLYRKRLSGGPAELLLATDGQKLPTDWSPDGRYIAYENRARGERLPKLFILPLFGDRKPFQIEESHINAGSGAFSPDGRWLAYTSDKSGRDEVYIASFPSMHVIQQVSAGGGSVPRWSQNGKEVIFVGPERKFVAAQLAFGKDGVDVLSRRTLFESTAKTAPAYDVTPDGQRILVNTSEERLASPFVLVINWSADLGKQ